MITSCNHSENIICCTGAKPMTREAERMECEKLACTEIVDHIKAHFKLQEAPK